MSNVPEGFQVTEPRRGRTVLRVRRKRSTAQQFLLVGGGIFALAVIAGLAIAVYTRSAAAPDLIQVADQEIEELKTLRFSVFGDGATDAGWFEFLKAPEGADLDRQTGVFTWTPTEAQGPGSYDVVIQLLDYDSQQPLDQVPFTVAVLEVDQPPVFDPIVEKSVALNESLYLVVDARDPDQPSHPMRFVLSDGPPGATINRTTGAIYWEASGVEPGTEVVFKVTATEAALGGLSATKEVKVPVTAPAPGTMAVASGEESDASSEEEAGAKKKEKMAEEEPAAPVAKAVTIPPAPDGPDPTNDAILAIYDKNKLFQPGEYAALRKIYADQFLRQHWADIHRGFGEDADAIKQWFEAEPAIRDELYTALDAEHDDVQLAVGLFKELKKQYPDAFPAYTELAIALAVTWDNEKGIYDYAEQQQRAGATAAESTAGPIDCFRYLIEAEKVMQGRAQSLPWEFLCYVVDHHTPLPERHWALLNYLPKRAMIGQCCSDVPYDAGMRDANSGGTAKIKDKPYTLANLRQYGGLPEMQVDFAVRVAKCLGVPAVYVNGRSASGGQQTWVSWVELANLSKGSVSFVMQSRLPSGGDRSYVGALIDPQRGVEITDRDLELRLHTVGLNPQAKRQAALVMKAYPMIRDVLKMDTAAQLTFLNQVIRLSPGSEGAWQAMAQMSRENKIDADQHRAMMASVDSLFRTFANFPDFTCKIFDDMVAFQNNPKQREKLYEKLVGFYSAAGRPDLSCETILKYADYLESERRAKEAIPWLAGSIQQMPGEGRYVPQMLDRLEDISKDVEGSQEALLRFYQEFLPKIPQMQNNSPSQYCVEMFERAIRRFKQANRNELVGRYEAQLILIKAGRGQRGR